MTDRVNLALQNADPSQVSAFTLSLVDRLQFLGEDATGQQIAAAGCLFRLLCERFGVEPEVAYRTAGRIIDASRYLPDAGKDFEATRLYLKGELA